MDKEHQRIKIAVGRAQLATALDLFIRDKDPVSVHCLAGGACEVLEGLASIHNEVPFSTHILGEHPNLNLAKLRSIQRVYWNSFKHLFKPDDKTIRDDLSDLQMFDDTRNDHLLFIGIHDYAIIAKALPIAAQVFQTWYYATNEDKLSSNADLAAIRQTWPDIDCDDRREQKRRLRRGVEKWRTNQKLLSDPKTEKVLHASPFFMTNNSVSNP